ncbi:helix-turn-helix transcriptional regulator [Streptomyces sp. NPDC085665]|uniref:helix-turn-helix transcriptional regulator n=1 Tax=Streptomyces sp. NPDC085665 TaxID=3365735 RepID=UPI0037D281D6
MSEELGVAARRFEVVGGGAEEPAPHRGSPVPLIRSLLGSSLVMLRKTAGLTGEEVVRLGAIGSTTTLSRVENGDPKARVTEAMVRGLAACYGVVEDSADFWALMQRWERLSSATTAWWDPYGDVLQADFCDLLYMENLASKITVCESTYVPGLLQTPRYMAAVMNLPFRGVPADRDRIQQRRDVRRQRQRLLERDNPPELTAFIDEAVTRRPYGGPQVLREQLRHLFNLCENQEAVHIRILPLAAYEHAAPLSPSSTLLGFPPEQQMPEALYAESPNVAGTWVYEEVQLDLHRAALLGVSKHALDKAKTMAFLKARLAELEDLV